MVATYRGPSARPGQLRQLANGHGRDRDDVTGRPGGEDVRVHHSPHLRLRAAGQVRRRPHAPHAGAGRHIDAGGRGQHEASVWRRLPRPRPGPHEPRRRRGQVHPLGALRDPRGGRPPRSSPDQPGTGGRIQAWAPPPRAGPRALTVEEGRQLCERLATDAEAVRLDLPDLVEFMLGTGVRIGEACAVRWSAVDLDAATVRIDATLIRAPGRGLEIQDFPKTTAGRRTIALPSFVVDLLERRRAQIPAAHGTAVIFPSPTGRLRDPHNTSSHLRRVLDRAGFDWVSSHVFRKTVATRLDEAGLSARQIADHLGHNRPSLTQDVYMGRGLASPEAATALQRSR